VLFVVKFGVSMKSAVEDGTLLTRNQLCIFIEIPVAITISNAT